MDKEGTEDLPREGFSVQKVSFTFVISLNGELKEVMDLRKFNDNKLLLQEMLVPEQSGRGGPKLTSYFLCDNVKYVLGIGDEENLPSFNSFKKLHSKYLESNNPILKFINSLEPSKAFENEILLKYKDEFEKSPNIVFRIELLLKLIEY